MFRPVFLAATSLRRTEGGQVVFASAAAAAAVIPLKNTFLPQTHHRMDATLGLCVTVTMNISLTGVMLRW